MPTFTAPSHAARLQVGCMEMPLESAYANLLTGSQTFGFTSPGTEALILPANLSPGGWPNQADSNIFLFSGSGVGLPIDPLMVGLIRFSFRGKCDGGFNVAGNCTNLQFDPYDNANDRTSGSFVTKANGLSYARLEFRGANFKDTDGSSKPGFRDAVFLRPRSPGNLAETYTLSQGYTDEFIAYLREFDYIRFFIAGIGLANWADRTPPFWWNQALGKFGSAANWPAYLRSARPGDGSMGPSFESMIAMANAADRDLLLCFPPNATTDFMRKFVRCVLYGTDAQGNPYDGPVSNPVHPPLNPSLKVTVEGGLEPWNFQAPYGVDLRGYGDLAEYHYNLGDEIGRALTYDLPMIGWPTNPREAHPDFKPIVSRMRVYQLHQIADAVREIDPSALHARIRTLFSNQSNGDDLQAIKWHESYFGRVDPASPYAGTVRAVRDDITFAGSQSYWNFGDEQGLTDAIADPSFGTPSISGYALRPAGGTWSFTGEAGIARSNGQDIPPAYAGQQVGYVGVGGRATISFIVPGGGTAAKKFDIKFKAVRRATDTGQARFKVFLDRGTPNELDITPRSTAEPDGIVAPRAYGDVLAGVVPKPASSWPARRVFYVDSDWYTSPALDLVPGSTHTVTVVGAGDADTVVFIGAVRVGSEDAILGSPHPLRGDNPDPKAYYGAHRYDSIYLHQHGIALHNYESAPHLGGDDHGTDLQQYARYLAPGMTDGQLDVYALLKGLGHSNVTQGVFRPVPTWTDPVGIQGLINPGDYAIIKAIRRVRAGNLQVTYSGRPVPATLNWANKDFDGTAYHNSYLNKPGETVTWAVAVDNPGIYRLTFTQYSINPEVKGPTSTDVMVDGLIVANGGDLVVAEVGLPAGPHWIRIRQRTGDSGEGQIVVERIGDLPDAGPATTYSLTVGNGRGVGTPIPVTITLIGGGPLGNDLSVTLACQGATTPGPITIPAGQASGSGSITPTAAGTFALSAANAGGLSNPAPLTLTFTAPPNPGPQPGTRRVVLFRR